MNITETIIVIICCAILGMVGIPYILTIIIAPLYFKFGIGKWFLHDGGKQNEVSKEYVDYVKNFYPKLAEQGVIDNIFGIDYSTEKGGVQE